MSLYAAEVSDAAIELSAATSDPDSMKDVDLDKYNKSPPSVKHI